MEIINWEAARNGNLRAATAEGLASIFHRELPVAGTVEGLDQFRFALTKQAMIQIYANAHYERRVGALDTETWDSIYCADGEFAKDTRNERLLENERYQFPKGIQKVHQR